MFANAMNPAVPAVARFVFGAMFLCMLAQASVGKLAAQASKGVHVCLGTDNLLRFTSGEKCPQGQRMFRLAEVEDEVGVTKERDDPPNAVVADLKTKVDFLSKRVTNLEKDSPDVAGDVKSKLDQLTQRVTNLENEGANRTSDPSKASRVVAPFEVVDKSGNPILVVTDGPHASVARKGRVQIARAVSNGFSILVRNASGSSVAGLGEVSEGGGVFLSNAKGETRLFGSADVGLTLYGKADVTAVKLAIGPSGAGQFWLYDAGGMPMVNAGTAADGVGIVQTGPNLACAPSAGLRVGDCLRGRR